VLTVPRRSGTVFEQRFRLVITRDEDQIVNLEDLSP
jgi:hypothetical protein